MKSKKFKLLAVIILLLLFYFLTIVGFRDGASKRIVRVNQEISELNSKTPEEYYQAVKKDLLQQKKEAEDFLKKKSGIFSRDN